MKTLSMLNTSGMQGLLCLSLAAAGSVHAFVIRPDVSSSTPGNLLVSRRSPGGRLLPLWTSPKPVFPPQVPENETEDCELTPVDFSDEILTEDLNPQAGGRLSDLEGLSSDDDLHWFRFGGVGRLYEDEQNPEEVVLDRLKRATVAIVGMGGMGSWTAEALCRSGIGHLVLIDLDDICISNTNRQLHTMSTNVGSMKTDVMRDRLVAINPFINITLIHDFVMLDNVEEVVGNQLKKLGVDVLVDSIDGDEEKAALIAACADNGVPVVTTGSPAGKNDPTQIVCQDLTQVRGDGLLRACRDRLTKNFDFQINDEQKPWNIAAVYSKQGVKESDAAESSSDTPSFASFRNDGNLGTVCFVTGTFGFVAASRVVEMIVDENLVQPSRG
mmetsp:Transcript_22629/g.42938  ORF Transcript_22629/g.42938 Transcript_22629/m.42938 type:complete len:385 (-) Transcript_22629:169-1323(-)